MTTTATTCGLCSPTINYQPGDAVNVYRQNGDHVGTGRVVSRPAFEPTIAGVDIDGVGSFMVRTADLALVR